MAERGLWAYVAEASRFKRDRDRLLELGNWLEEEYGPVTEDERAAASKELDELDAEHERRRAGGKREEEEAA
ncbi:CopG family transcriptional regulator [Nonomuraea rhodomycinica]|uniref:CopG family transcriptional regulator n=1 Tax=Nonomuraea rhodomycinica TaxID=1712872 RepID=UPI001C375B34|nr:CopG family transcriptional regulator [Nonomuraea rhodomycinica]